MKSNKNIVIGIDIGTGGVKAELFDMNGKSLAFSFRKSRLITPSPETVEEDPEFQLSSLCAEVSECMKNSRRSPSDVAAIGIDGQMAGIIGIGRDGRCVTPYDSWLDTRCTQFISTMNKTAGEEILLKSGCAPAVNHGPKIIWWMMKRPEVFKRIRSFVQPAGYAAMRLCGLNVTESFIDGTYLHFSGFADNAKSCWDEALCRKFGLDMSLLPRIVRPEEIIGELSSGMAKKCGLRPGIPVVAGCGDTAASFLSCGAASEGVCVDVAGTASVFAVTTGKFKPDRDDKILACGQAVTPGLRHSYAYINGGGMNLNWFRDQIVCAGGAADNNSGFEEMHNMITGIKPDTGLPLFIPHLGGRVSPAQPEMRGAWLNLSWSHGRAHLFRAVLESVALEYMIYIKAVRALYPDIALGELRVTGGGEKSRAWNQIKADALNLPARRIAHGHGAPLGAAIVAAWGAGLIENPVQAAVKWIKPAGIFTPNTELADFYKRRLKQYENALILLKEKL